MAIETGAIFKRLYFDGQSSGTYGVYITGEAVYNAPVRDVEMIKIPGRDGEFALDNGRFENIEVTYPAGIFADNEADFAAAISDFRNFLASRVGYCRLEDEYNPNEYRMAVYKSGLNVDPAKLEAGEFSITFDCKPQRWLKDGETAVAIGEWGETETVSGDIVSVENPNGILAVKSLEVDIEPIQDLNGYDKPWVGGAGKNKFSYPYTIASSGTINGVTYTVNGDGSITLTGTATGQADLALFSPNGYSLDSGTYKITLGGIKNGIKWIYGGSGSALTYNELTHTVSDQTLTMSADGTCGYCIIRIASGTATNVTLYPMIRLSTENDSSWQPYSNICPISGRTEVETVVSPTTSAEDGTTYTTALGRTVYGGNLEQISGVLTDGRYYYEPLSSTPWQLYDGGKLIGKSFSPLNLPKPYIKAVGSVEENILSSHFVKMSQNDARYNTNGVAISQWNGNEFIYFSASAFGDSLDTFKAYLDAQRASGTPVQVVYELATPQTYQLTPQQISLLTGDNNIWSDGAITLEYGQNPSVLFNPTLFESSPFLEAEGEGIINFNGYEIDLDGVPYGEVTIGEPSYGWHTSPVTVTLDTTLLNIGDAIYPQTKDCYIRARLKKTAGYNLYLNSVSSTTNMLEVTASSHTGKNGDEFHIKLYPDFGDGFVYGTSKTITCTAVIIYRVGSNPAATPTYTETIEITIAYDGTDTYTVAVLSTGTLPPDTTRISWALSVPIMYGNSTKAVSDVPIYIDCDLGEAYIIIDGAYVSLNHRIDLGSDMPTLGVGANEVTFDNTITELKITPRFWKV